MARPARSDDPRRRLLPFPLLGFDTDNGREFLNELLFDYCDREQITFTRGRTANKNDQCYVEQKNGSVVRHWWATTGSKESKRIASSRSCTVPSAST